MKAQKNTPEHREEGDWDKKPTNKEDRVAGGEGRGSANDDSAGQGNRHGFSAAKSGDMRLARGHSVERPLARDHVCHWSLSRSKT